MFSRRAGHTVGRLLYRSVIGHRRSYLLAILCVTMLASGIGKVLARWQTVDRNFQTQPLPFSVPLAGRSHFVTPALRDISSTAVSSVSAASFEGPVAPDSIVAAFGDNLATQTVAAFDADPNTPGIQLPTELAGTTVDVNGRRAGLFFVSKSQVNYLIPPQTEIGTANVAIRSGDGTLSNGTVQVVRVAPSIFAANTNGKGVAAATALRVKPGNVLTFESISQFNPQVNRHLTKPIDLGPEGEDVFLVLFLTGIRRADDPSGDNNLNESFRVLIGGNELVPVFAGRQPDFVGLDQVNVRIPRELFGRGIVSVSVSATGFTTSNLVEIEIAGAGGVSPPQVSGFGAQKALAGQPMIIMGNGFSPIPAENLVRIAGLDADVMSSSLTRLTVMVPFGVETGTVSVRTAQGEGVSPSVLPVRTSVSGLVENTARQPLGGVTIRTTDPGIVPPITATSSDEGLFVLPDVPEGVQFVEVDGNTVPTNPPYPKVTLKTFVHLNRDNQFSLPIALQQSTGSGGTIGSGSSFGGGGSSNDFNSQVAVTEVAAPNQDPQPVTIQTGDFKFEVPADVKVKFPNGATSGTIFLTPLKDARTPVELPKGFYSSSIVQITPFRVELEPGGRLIFPNTDRFPAGAPAKLFRYDHKDAKFVEDSATAAVSADGLRIETAPGAIKITSFYFAAISTQMTTITGRVIEKDEKPVPRALARFRGQEATTDGNGSYTLRFVPINSGENISVDVSYVRPNGRVEKVQSAPVPAILGGITKVPDVKLPGPQENRPPTILVADRLQIDEGKTTDVSFVVTDPDPNQTFEVKVEGARFASVILRGTVSLTATYLLRLSPGFSDAGNYKLSITATDTEGAKAKEDIDLQVKNVNRPPAAKDNSVTGDEDSRFNINLEATDPENDHLTYTVLSQPANGSLSGNAPALVYRPSLNFNGTDRFTFKASDGRSDSNVATVTMTVRPINDPPVLSVPGAQSVDEGKPLNFAVSATDPDAGQTLTISVDGNLPQGATFRLATPTSGQFSWTPDSRQSGNYTVTFKATDNATPPGSDVKGVRITVHNAHPAQSTVAQQVKDGRTLPGVKR